MLLSSLTAVQAANWNGRATPVTCSICRDANRPILNPNKSFTMNNGNTWTCHYLQETVQDVNAQSSNPSEALMCAQAQLQGENGGCQCGGTPMNSIQSQVSNPNAACDLCAGQASRSVPSSNYDTTVATGVAGTHNCHGLEVALASGILSSTLCPAIQRAAGATCCSSSGSSSFSSRPSITSSSNTNTNNSNSNANISYNTGAVSSPSPNIQYNTAGANGSGNERQSINAGYNRQRIGGPTTGRGGRTASSASAAAAGTGTIRGAAAPLP
mmetsp:Transcript_62662/g.70109  ORF Transcript_62662/g.70109 Transcript_62662/m.70109 type:complete len:270 (-) Transcript_62662:65-874(-)